MTMITNAIIKQGAMYSGEKASRCVGGPDGLLANMVPFKSAGNMSADAFMQGEFERPGGLGGGLGRLSSYWCTQIMAATPIYVVYSWATPIAWVSDFGDVTIPGDSYSPTTKHHQGLCRAWLKADSSTMLSVYAKMDEGTWTR